MDTTILIRPVRDRDGYLHNVNEPIIVKSKVQQASAYDNHRILLSVTFSNGATGAVFATEIGMKTS